MSLNLTFVVFLIFIQKIYSQTICYNPTSNCFDPVITQTLLFQYGQHTTCSRTSPIYKLNCVDGNTPESFGLCSKYSQLITNIKCENSGTDESNNVVWKCNGILPSNVALGTTTVSCEGCTSSSDKLKISGSCGIFYQLVKKPISSPTSTTKTELKYNLVNGYTVIICFILGVFLVIGLIKCCTSKQPEYLPVYTNGSRTHYYNQIPTAERVVIPEIIPLTAEQTNINPPTNPNYTPNTSNRTLNISQYPNYQTQSNIETGGSRCVNQRQSDTSSLLTGYLVGKNLEEGNFGTAYLASTIGNNSSGNNYSTGMMMGLISGSEHSSKTHHKNKSHHKSHDQSYDLESYQNKQNYNSFDNSETYANTTTR